MNLHQPTAPPSPRPLIDRSLAVMLAGLVVALLTGAGIAQAESLLG